MSGDDAAPVTFSRLSRRTLLLGLSVPQVVSLGLALVLVVAGLYTGGGLLWWSSPVWVGSLVVALVPAAGRPLVEWLPLTVVWVWRRLRGQTGFRRRVLRPRPAGTLGLPGDAAALRALTDPASGAAMVHDPHRRWLVAMAEIGHGGFVLLDPAEQSRRVAGWGRVLAGTCRSGRIARLQVLERTLPDSGSGLTAWWATNGVDDGSWVAATYRQLIEQAGPAGERHTTTISLALDLKAAARAIRTAGGGLAGATAVLRQEMHTLTGALRSADLGQVTWLDPARLAHVLRTAYDPQATRLDGTGIGGLLETAGPVAVEETWEALRTDSGWHAVLWIAEWPRQQVYPGFLAPLLLSGGPRRALSLVCEPVRADVAARELRRRKTGHLADATQRARMGQVADAAQTAAYHDTLAQEADLVAGHGVLRYCGLLAVTAPTAEELEAAVAEIEQAAIQASCETRRLVGQQAQGFTAAALPLCRGL